MKKRDKINTVFGAGLVVVGLLGIAVDVPASALLVFLGGAVLLDC